MGRRVGAFCVETKWNKCLMTGRTDVVSTASVDRYVLFFPFQVRRELHLSSFKLRRTMWQFLTKEKWPEVAMATPWLKQSKAHVTVCSFSSSLPQRPEKGASEYLGPCAGQSHPWTCVGHARWTEKHTLVLVNPGISGINLWLLHNSGLLWKAQWFFHRTL